MQLRVTVNVMASRHKFVQYPLITCTLVTLAISLATGANAAEVYRWVDENGDVHYSEALPPHLRDQQHDVLNERGIVLEEDQTLTPPPPQEPEEEPEEELPRDSSGMPRVATFSDSEIQQRLDNFLLLRYDSEQEIEDAMNVEIKQLNYDRRLLETSRQSTNEAYRGHIRQAAERQRAGQEVSAEVDREISDLQDKLAENSISLQGVQKREKEIKAEFQKQMDRYRYLMETYDEEASGS